jgi:hypothetical protein
MTDFKNVQMLDITAPEFVQVEWDSERKVLYVHVDGVSVLRCCRVKEIEISGARK